MGPTSVNTNLGLIKPGAVGPSATISEQGQGWLLCSNTDHFCGKDSRSWARILFCPASLLPDNSPSFPHTLKVWCSAHGVIRVCSNIYKDSLLNELAIPISAQHSKTKLSGWLDTSTIKNKNLLFLELFLLALKLVQPFLLVNKPVRRNLGLFMRPPCPHQV